MNISKTEYELLLRYRDIVKYMEEMVHEELNVKPLQDMHAIKILEKLEKEARGGKRKTISDREFSAHYKHLM
ncbi:MAG: hypothetical protein AABW86_05785 [Candidatus Micrarchaeota archaeon]